MLDDRLGLAGRTVIVAGAGGGGIGTAVCRLLAEAGVAVAAIDNDPTRLAMAEAALEGTSHAALVADVRRKEEVEPAVAAAADRLGRLHGLVHVVGGLSRSQWEPLLTTSPEAFDDVAATNLRSALLTSQATAARLMAEGRPGSIVHIASIAGLAAMPFAVAYAASKAGLMSLTRTAAVEWGRQGIRVNAVAPGTVRTARNTAGSDIEETADHAAEDRAAIPLGRRGRPEDIAGAALFLLSDLASFISGQVLAVDGASSVKPSYLDPDNLPVFVRDDDLRRRLRK